MCGICGIVHLGRPAQTEAVSGMVAALDHRGPDGRGSYARDGVALAHRRLSIIDLSEAGSQPFASEDGRFQLVHNGEVYNHRELRTELETKGHRFRSGTDTEVILRSFVEWGQRCVHRFNGMWAFAIWDSRDRRLFCSRDRLGVKPFYFRLDRDRLVFASELKAFRADPETALRPNPRAVLDYVEQGWLDHTDETFFEGIVKLPPAHSLVFDERGLRTHRYWRLEHSEPVRGDPAPEVRELVLDAVKLRLRSDVPVGTCLSGGIDSSTIASAVAHLLRTDAVSARSVGARQRTFTVFFDERGFDERPYAETVVDWTGAEPHWISCTDEDVVDALPTIVRAQDEPFGSTSVVAQWFVMREAKRAGLKVLLDGQGADELLAGYHGSFGPFFVDLLLRREFERLRLEVAAYRSLHGASVATVGAAFVRPFVPKRLLRAARARVGGGGSLVHADLRGVTRPSPDGNGPYPDRLRRHLHRILTRRGLPELLRYEDRNSMAHSLEARVPFLDYRLVELFFSLEAGQLIEHGRTKSVLRRAFADLLPPAVRDRVDKLGFVTPEARWFRGALGELAADVFASRSFAERGFVDARAARRRLDRHRRGQRSAGFELWRALNLELWARGCLDAAASR